ncbi:MAG: hypothetical protein M1834_008675 [Cirrosporium novae-zelandiae]|nr:MAG: hypothetical protein M1834_008675 [Cirrosporium novae-zelandiae]
MAGAYISTPQTDDGNFTFLPDDRQIDNMSPEKSFQSPSKDNNLFASLKKKNQGSSFRTPRVPFTDRRNFPAGGRPEFTPLMKSVTKSNFLRSETRQRGPVTPAVLKPGYRSAQATPALPAADSSVAYEEPTTSSAIGDLDGTSVPQVISSSAQSTPLAKLPPRDGEGALDDGRNKLTLKEQEKIVDRIEKDNFGLKLKIHYLEAALKKAGPGFNQAALQENTELKVSKVMIERELHRHRKRLALAEREIENYRQELANAQMKSNRKNADESLREELDWLRKEVEMKNKELEELEGKLEDASESGKQELEKLRDEVQDLEADIQERDREIEEKDDKIEALENDTKQDKLEAELKDELNSAKRRIGDLEQKQSNEQSEHAKLIENVSKELSKANAYIEALKLEAQEAKGEAEKAKNDFNHVIEERERAENNLNELQEEMANKSIVTKGLSRQREEKTKRLEGDIDDLRRQHVELQQKFDEKSRQAQKLQDQMKEIQEEGSDREQQIQDKLDLALHERDIAIREQQSIIHQAENAVRDLQQTAEEKDLLQMRHNALTSESQSLQRELQSAKGLVKRFEANLEKDRQHSFEQDRELREQAEEEIEGLHEDIDSLQRQIEEKENQAAADRDLWESQRRNLESQRQRAEEQAAGLKQTIEKLRQVEGTLSSKEMKLSEALESEKQRHQREDAVSAHQVEELQADVNARRQALEDLRSELSATKEELRASKRTQGTLQEKVQALEDEVEVLESSLDEEVEHVKAQFSERLHESEVGLQKVRAEKHKLQDDLRKANSDLQSLRTSFREMEAERDEVKSQLHQMEDQVDETFKVDQEKMDLRKAKLRLEGDVARLREERKALIERGEAAEKDLQVEMERANEEEAHLEAELVDLRQKLVVLSEGRDRELVMIKSKSQRLELRAKELEALLQDGDRTADATVELSIIKNDLEDARKKEMEYVQREGAYKDNIRNLKQRVVDMERQIHELQMSQLAMESPRSSVGSARKDEIDEARRQLSEVNQQMRELRSKMKSTEKEAQRKLSAVERENRTKIDALEQDRESLEQEISDLRQQEEELLAKNTQAEETIGRLRTRVQGLEKGLHKARQDQGDKIMADERRDLHEMLKDAKLEAEDLQLQAADRDAHIQACASREQELRAQLKRVREERSHHARKAHAATEELSQVQQRYEEAVDNLAQQQQMWQEERKAITQRVRFPNTSVSSAHANRSSEDMEQLQQEIEAKEKKHLGEIKGLAKQIQYLRAKCNREENFRADLAFSKKFFLMQIEMFNACNAADLRILEEMGITPDRRTRERRPSLRAVGMMVIATVRIRKLQSNWAANKKVHALLSKKAEQVRRQSRHSLTRG